MKVTQFLCKKKHARRGPSLLRENQKLVPLDRHLSQLHHAWHQVKPHEREQCLLEALKLRNDDGDDVAAVAAEAAHHAHSAVAEKRAKQKSLQDNGPTATKLTGGVCEPVSYWSAHGTTNASYQWRHFFNKVYYENHLDTAPTFTCPFCLQRAFEKRAKQQPQRGGPRPASANEAMQHLDEEIHFLRECMAIDGALPKYSPTAIQRHAAWLHPQQGWEQTSLQVHNRFMLAHLKHRLRHHHLVELEYLREVQQESKVAEGEKEKQCKEAKLVRHHVPPFKLILLLDVANLELGGDALLSVLADRDAQHTFSTFPFAICAMHELFIPHTSRVLHAAFQLAQLHPHSEFYNFYSCTRAEAGDILTAWLAAALREGRQPLAYYDDPAGSDADRSRVQIASSHDPPIVLLTKDSQQRMCMTEVFGAGTPTAAPGGTLRATRQVQLAAIMHVIKEALQSSWSPPY